eukprot:CAMPEP_0180444022 /NCGR_PEP_ID=MMETSP1036_2-20121128/14974_1 /TAXON_ID=632150 /ORGANISM="Azadinium spinosum, Strain 3D9" /LENGTH=49 /DNA_ID=CAMNT_0022450349 /DNA_START=106 /DNA_END=256 /DNA_ORIENTATION=+
MNFAVDEDILTAVVWGDEAEALLLEEFFTVPLGMIGEGNGTLDDLIMAA